MHNLQKKSYAAVTQLADLDVYDAIIHTRTYIANDSPQIVIGNLECQEQS